MYMLYLFPISYSRHNAITMTRYSLMYDLYSVVDKMGTHPLMRRLMNSEYFKRV